jgi:hypothetical protein
MAINIALSIAGCVGFLTLIHSRQRPERYRLSRRLATMPSSPMTHACRNTTAPSTLTQEPLLSQKPSLSSIVDTGDDGDSWHSHPGRLPRRPRCHVAPVSAGLVRNLLCVNAPPLVTRTLPMAQRIALRCPVCAPVGKQPPYRGASLFWRRPYPLISSTFVIISLPYRDGSIRYSVAALLSASIAFGAVTIPRCSAFLRRISTRQRGITCPRRRLASPG